MNFTSKMVLLTALAAMALAAGGCATPNVSSHNTVSVDEDIIPGGLSSTDIRTVASQMCPEILSLPEIYDAGGVVRVAMSPMKNSSRFIIDMDIFMKRLRADLNKYGNNQIRFFSQNNARRTRSTVLSNRREDHVDKCLDEIAEKLVSSYVVTSKTEPLKVAVVPVLNTNFVNMNADSITALLRTKVADKSNGKILFTMPGVTDVADYYLTGQFIAESLKQEGIVNLVDYIGLMEDRMEKGESLDLYPPNNNAAATSGNTVGANNSGNQVNIVVGGGANAGSPSLLKQIQASSRLRVEPNVTKKLNVMLIDKKDKLAVFEKSMTIESKVTDGTGKASLILSGELSGLSKRVNGTQSDYMLITMQLVDPDSNEILWEGMYEVKRASRAGVVYQ